MAVRRRQVRQLGGKRLLIALVIVCLAAAGLMAGAMVWAEFEARDSLTAGVLALGIMAMLLREGYYQWRQEHDRRL